MSDAPTNDTRRPDSASPAQESNDSVVTALRAENARLKAAILDIDAHATGLGEDEDGFVSGGYLISIGSLHRALGIIGHTAPPCRICTPESHDCEAVDRG